MQFNKSYDKKHHRIMFMTNFVQPDYELIISILDLHIFGFVTEHGMESEAVV